MPADMWRAYVPPDALVNHSLIIDMFLFKGEWDYLNIWLYELYHLVDTFAIVESSEDFNGDPKPLYFSENAQLYDKFKNKIHVVILPLMPQDYRRAGEALFG